MASSSYSTYQPRRISAKLSVADIAEAIDSSSRAPTVTPNHGVLIMTDLPKAPIAEIQAAFDNLAQRPDIVARLNEAYKKNLVLKDSFAMGNGGPKVDMKRVLDLSPERLEQIQLNDPDLHLSMLKEGALGETLQYWNDLRTTVAPKIVSAVATAVGSEDIQKDAAFNYRMVDYYQRNEDDIDSLVAPRCGDHRDFGSFTLIFPNDDGFQVNIDGEWMDLPTRALEEGSAILLFGWCTQIRSNGRIPAALHRVSDADGVTRRTSAVLFCAPKHAETPLEPVVRDGEERVYISGIKAGQLRGKMARKWQKREGTLSEEGKILEEKEILATNMFTQDDVVDTIRSSNAVAVGR